MTMKNGREVIVEMKCWNDVLIRSKGTANMKDKPMDLLHVGIRDKQSGELVFDRPMFWLLQANKKAASAVARHNKAIAADLTRVAYRFWKQNLLMGK